MSTLKVIALKKKYGTVFLSKGITNTQLLILLAILSANSNYSTSIATTSSHSQATKDKKDQLAAAPKARLEGDAWKKENNCCGV